MDKEIAAALLAYRRVYREVEALSTVMDTARESVQSWDGRRKDVRTYEKANAEWMRGLDRRRTAFDELVSILMKDFNQYSDEMLERIIDPPTIMEFSSIEYPILTIYTDGAAVPNPGKGAYAFVLADSQTGAKIYEDKGFVPEATNNQMELRAVIEALRTGVVQSVSSILIVTDSEYVRKGITMWIKQWETNGWKTANGSVKNRDLWETLAGLTKGKNIRWQWTRGHSGSAYNERCDQLCTEVINANSSG